MSALRSDDESDALIERMTGVLTSELGESVDAGDVDYIKGAVSHLLVGLRSRKAWSMRIGDILTATQARDLGGWKTRQAFHKAVVDHRVLRLVGANGENGYSTATFADSRPAKPILGAVDVLRVWSVADPRGWATASWLTTGQPGLGGRTPRQALLDGDVRTVVQAAEQAADAYGA